MSMPGFTAYVCLSGQSNYYCYSRSQGSKGTNPSAVLHLQRATGPTGPIGLPGQTCDAACWHICKMSGGGWFFDQCMAHCQSSCSEPSFNALL